jgi:hypothetical protein
MRLKLVFGVIAVAMVLAFLSPIVFKLNEASLSIIILIGVAMIVYDLWESLQEKDV